MELPANAEERRKSRRERRACVRHTLDEPVSLLLVRDGETVSGRIIDLSLGGCRIRTDQRFLAGMLVRVEVVFKILGTAFRLPGVTQWTDRGHLAAIRFIDMTARRTDALAELIAEVESGNTANGAERGDKAATKETHLAMNWVGVRTQPAVHIAPKAADVPIAASAKEKPQAAHSVAGPAPAADLADLSERQPKPPEAAQKPGAGTRLRFESGTAAAATVAARLGRPIQPRHKVDTSAVIHLIDLAAVVRGRILDVSLGGCCIRSDQRFPLGIFRRVEAEFRIEGLPFRLGGVTQALYDRCTVGIRFLDVSARKQEQLNQLVEEIKELRERERAGQDASTEMDGDGSS